MARRQSSGIVNIVNGFDGELNWSEKDQNNKVFIKSDDSNFNPTCHFSGSVE